MKFEEEDFWNWFENHYFDSLNYRIGSMKHHFEDFFKTHKIVDEPKCRCYTDAIGYGINPNCPIHGKKPDLVSKTEATKENECNGKGIHVYADAWVLTPTGWKFYGMCEKCGSLRDAVQPAPKDNPFSAKPEPCKPIEKLDKSKMGSEYNFDFAIMEKIDELVDRVNGK